MTEQPNQVLVRALVGLEAVFRDAANRALTPAVPLAILGG